MPPGTYLLDVTTGNSTRMKLIGRNFVTSGADISMNIVRYETTSGVDFTHLFEDAANLNTLIRGIKFNAAKRYTAEIPLDIPTSLTDTPLNLETVMNNTSDALTYTDISWTEDTDFSSRILDFSLVATSTSGVTKLIELVSVSGSNKHRVLFAQHPDIFTYRSADGAPMFSLSANGRLSVPTVALQRLRQYTETFSTNVDLSSYAEFAAFNMMQHYGRLTE